MISQNQIELLFSKEILLLSIYHNSGIYCVAIYFAMHQGRGLSLPGNEMRFDPCVKSGESQGQRPRGAVKDGRQVCG